jgi:hypothetical protein
MKTRTLSLDGQYWDNFKLQNEDVEFLYNLMLDRENPLSEDQLISELIAFRIESEIKKIIARQEASERIYLPKEKYEVGERIVFPHDGWCYGEIDSVREGFNPDLSTFKVISVKMKTGISKEFASELAEHKLNQSEKSFEENSPYLDHQFVCDHFLEPITKATLASLGTTQGFVCVGKRWFPQSLLVDINIGHLNLAEAVLEMADGGPLSGNEILDSIEFHRSDNPQLLEFSLNHALYCDERFDEVGPAGEVQWFLKRLEPKEVLETPVTLIYEPFKQQQGIAKDVDLIDTQLYDELDDSSGTGEGNIQIALIFPHWRAGTLPLTSRTMEIFPTALEAPRIRFSFVDASTHEKFPGWVIRSKKYVYGLSDWYKSRNLIPGSLFQIQKSENSGEVLVSVQRRHSNREWLRTVQITNDANVSLKLLKQPLATTTNDRMTLFIPETKDLDKIWDSGNWKTKTLENITRYFMKELIKLSPQGHVHFEEIYASINLVRRCPPNVLLNTLLAKEWAQHLGDLYFRLIDSGVEHDVSRET